MVRDVHQSSWAGDHGTARLRSPIRDWTDAKVQAWVIARTFMQPSLTLVSCDVLRKQDPNLDFPPMIRRLAVELDSSLSLSGGTNPFFEFGTDLGLARGSAQTSRVWGAQV